MTFRFELVTGRYLHVTPSGAWRAAQRTSSGRPESLVRTLLGLGSTPAVDRLALAGWTGLGPDAAVEVLWQAQERGWIEAVEEPLSPPDGPLEDLLPRLLAQLSSSGQVLLADSQGFCLASAGVDAQRAVDLCAISADLASLQERHRSEIADVVEGDDISDAWALVDEVGNSRVGFWPLHIGLNRFVLVATEMPYLHDPVLATLVWTLGTRYGSGARPEPAELGTVQ